MKKTIALSAASLALLIVVTVRAQPPGIGGGPAFGPSVEQGVDRMKAMLDLTSQQEADIRTILEAQCTRRKAEIASVRKQIDSVLTMGQRAKRDARIDGGIKRHVARIAEQLGLSSEQEEKVRALIKEYRGNPPCAAGEMRERLSGVLTGDQLAKWEEVRSHRGFRGRSGRKASRPQERTDALD